MPLITKFYIPVQCAIAAKGRRILGMTAIAQTTMMAASLAILIYIAVITSGNFISTQNVVNQTSFTEQSKADSALREEISSNLNYVHKADMNTASQTVLLNGLNLSKNQFVLLYDSTPYAAKGHIALNLPCDATSPNSPLFQVLVGRAPDIVPTTLGYIANISSPPDMCVYHSQFGFGDPVTDVVLKYVADGSVDLRGPYSVVITTHESYIPTVPSFKDIQHQKGY